VIVVDDDIDIYDWDNVAWAITFRTSLIQGRRRLSFVEGLGAPSLDYSGVPSLEELHKQIWPSAGVFIDATRPYTPYPTVALPATKYWDKVKATWGKYGLPDLERAEVPKCVVMEEEHLAEGRVKNPEFVPPER
jgi:3-polyprenyl-4-hydroxybenzoate decarboxylase